MASLKNKYTKAIKSIRKTRLDFCIIDHTTCNSRETLGSRWNDEKLLKWQLVTSMFTTIDDIEARNGQGFWDGISGQVGIMLPKRNAPSSGTCLAHSQGYCSKKKLQRTTSS
jgi:hypothetical protein